MTLYEEPLKKSLNKKKAFVYILLLQDNTFYIGYTTNIQKRLLAHNAGTAAKRTRGRTPVKLLYYEVFTSKSTALKREIELKKLNRKEKERLIASKNFTILS